MDRPEPSPEDRLRQIERPVRRRVLTASVAATLASLVWLLQAWLVAELLASFVTPDPDGPAPAGLVAAFVVLGMARIAINAVAEGSLVRAAEDALESARSGLIGKAALAGGDALPSADLASLAAERLDAVAPWMTRYRPATLRMAVVPPVILLLAAVTSWAAALILLVAGPLIPLFMALIGMAAREASERQMREIGSMNTLLAERIRAMPDMILLDATGNVVADFARAAERLRARTMAVLRIAFLSSAVLELFAALGVAMMAVLVGFSLLGEIRFGTWGAPLGLGEGIFLLLLAPEFFQPLRDFAAAWHDRAAALAVAGELAAAETGMHAGILGQGGAAAPLPGPATIRTHGLAWAPQGGRTLDLPDVEIAAGQSVAVTGPSGSGKSTLLALLAGLLRPGEGWVEVAGIPLDEAVADAWRARIGWVGQAPHFLNATLQANVVLGTRADAARFSAAAGEAGLVEAMAAMPDGERTRLGELGQGVSGGEARRILVARALCKGADVILADEPTADLDAATAAQVTDALLAAHRAGATLVVATHDLALAERMHQRIDLEARQ
ncbi:thiol reductant ABC exporter subunit CydD [Zhengella mangrovi]|uniref:Thiol reductant ABC exporter subunit CydD n=1 Tax=Zhengella mangrovi TaxID=1982044 RepID=A0A2G1QGS6_9HYPH|nr:thiol reductant ABC exporter subunit CydD [Zhengella mangrovi]PHP64716.1 thiol reductant ABC exporter subunit CydD [Zhengella mangrovi]